MINADFPNFDLEKKDLTNENKANKPVSFEKYHDSTQKLNTVDKNENFMKVKKKLNNVSDPSLLEADILNESYSEVSNIQIIRVFYPPPL